MRGRPRSSSEGFPGLRDDGIASPSMSFSAEDLLDSCRVGNERVAVEIIREGSVQVNIADSKGNTPLHYAVMSDNLSLVRYLVENGASQSRPNNNGLPAYEYAKSQLVRRAARPKNFLTSKSSARRVSITEKLEDFEKASLTSGGSMLSAFDDSDAESITSASALRLSSGRLPNVTGLPSGMHSDDDSGSEDTSNFAARMVRAAQSFDLQSLEDLLSQAKRQQRESRREARKMHRSSPSARKIVSDDGIMDDDDDVRSVSSTTTVNTSRIEREFVEAAKRGDVDAMEEMIDAGVNINARDEVGMTALHRAVYWEREKAVQVLVQRGADRSIKNRRGQTAEDICKTEMILKVLKGKKYRKQSMAERYRRQSSIARERSMKMMMTDDEAGQSSRGRAKWDYTKKLESVEDEFAEAGKQGDLGAVQVLHELRGVDIDAQDRFGWTCLHRAVYWARKEVIRYLVSKGARYDIKNRSGKTALDIAPSEEILILVLGDNYARESAISRKASIRKAVHDRRARMINASDDGLLNSRRGSQYSYKRKLTSKEDEFVEACKQGRLKEVKRLIENSDVSPDAKDRFGWTGLQRAVFWNRSKVVKFLVEKGADVNIQNPKGKSAVDMAPSEELRMVLEGDDYVPAAEREARAKRLQQQRRAKLLTSSEDGLSNSRGVKANWSKRRKESDMSLEELLVESCKRGALKRVKRLHEEEGVGIDAADKFGWTGLHRAVFWDRQEVVRYLISHGADPRKENGKGQNALDLSPSEEMRRLLQGKHYVDARHRRQSKIAPPPPMFIAPRVLLRTSSAKDMGGMKPPEDSQQSSSSQAKNIAKRKRMVAKFLDEDQEDFKEDLGIDALMAGRGAAGATEGARKTFMSDLMAEIARIDSSSLRDDDVYKWSAMYVRDALAGRTLKTDNFGRAQLKVRRFITSTVFRWVIAIVVTAQLLLPVWEPVSYREIAAADATHGALNDYPDRLRGAFVAEALVMLVHIIDLLLNWFEKGARSYWQSKLYTMKTALVCATLADMALFALFATPRLTRILRVGFVFVHTRSLRYGVSIIAVALPRLADVVLFVFALVGVYACIGLFLFSGETQREGAVLYDRGTVTERVNSFQYSFSTFGQALLTMYAALTGANYPDVMYPAYRQNRWVGALFFVSYELLAAYVLLNLFIPKVYSGFKEAQRRKVLRDAARERKALAAAFAVLDTFCERDESGELTFDMCSRLFRNVTSAIDGERMRLVYTAINGDKNGKIGIIEFFTLYEQFQIEMAKPRRLTTSDDLAKRASYFRRRSRPLLAAALTARRAVLNLVWSRMFYLVVLWAIALDILVLALLGSVSASNTAALFRLDNVITILFVVEFALKVVAFSPRGYIANNWNVLDGAVTLAAALGLILSDVVDEYGWPADLLRVLKILRVFRLCLPSSRLEEFLDLFWQLMPSIAEIVFWLVMFVYIFTIIAMEVFSARFNNFYDPLGMDFSHFSETALVMLQLMLLTNWDKVLIAARDTVGDYFPWFIFVFQFFAVFVFVNIMIAMILDTFEFEEQSRKMERDAEKRERQQSFVESVVSGGGGSEGGDTGDSPLFSLHAAVATSNRNLFQRNMEMRSYLESILNSIQHHVVSLDLEGRLTSANRQEDFEALVGAPMEVLMDETYHEWIGDRNPELLEAIQGAYSRNRKTEIKDYEFVTESENIVHLDIDVVPLRDFKKERKGVLLIMDDVTEEKRMRSTLGRYLSPGVAEQVLADQSQLGGKRQNVSVLFSDIRSFTSISEALDAPEIVDLLNEYFHYMVDCVFENNGILDKYIGDALMAVFGVPFVKEDDALRSCRAALLMLRRLKLLNEKRVARGQDAIHIGIGINSGPAVSGNIGSEKRMEYTVIGDTVNLASRIEGVTKKYKLSCLVTEFCVAQTKGAIIVREIDTIRVMGKKKGIRIYELLGESMAEVEPEVRDSIPLYEDALRHYRAGEFEDAQVLFDRCVQMCSHGASMVMRDRCAAYVASPPKNGEWAVFNMDSK